MIKLPVSICRSISVTAAAVLTLTGCAISRVTPTAVNGAALHGVVHGGQQPVSGATIQLFAAGATGNASAATPLLTASVLTSESGGFDITGDYTCPTATTQVYLAATGGNPGLGAGANNNALAMVTALGDCSNLPGMQSVSINELTTVAAVWALAPFASGVDHVGASATNLTGLRNAMQVAMMMADSNSGVAPSPSMPDNARMETGKLITMADLLAACVNSDGLTLCAGLFADATPAGLPMPGDTFQAGLTIVQNPAVNVAALFNDVPARGPYAGTLTVAPHDWSMSIAYTGGGLQDPGDVSVDATGNLWVADRSGALSGYLPSGAPMWNQGLTGLGLSGTVAVSIDPAGNVWAANSGNAGPNTSGSVTEVTTSGQAMSSPFGYVDGVNAPVAVALGADGRAWIANSGQSNVQVLNADGTQASPVEGYGANVLNMPSAIAITAASDAWIANQGSGDLVLINSQGSMLKQIHCSVAPDSLALDLAGNVWVGDSANGTLLLVASYGVFSVPISGAGLGTPRSPTIDGAGNLFVLDAGTGSIASMPHSILTSDGQLTGPFTSLGQDAVLRDPTASALDASGSLWVTSAQDSKLVRYVGVASPVKTPLLGAPVAP